MSKDNFSDFELNLNNNETDLTAEIAQQLKQMNGNNLKKFKFVLLNRSLIG